ncbi:MAG: hypothetical protein M0C28_08155, partial [Candidatus Moduliflexus flocculans]|nr:hypothetical protein [Candidatus Moduliflexus flocculans]
YLFQLRIAKVNLVTGTQDSAPTQFISAHIRNVSDDEAAFNVRIKDAEASLNLCQCMVKLGQVEVAICGQ